MTHLPASSHGSAYSGLSSGIVFQTGSGEPIGTVTPSQKGALYQDTTNGALFVAIGATSADWVGVGGLTTSGATVRGTTFGPDKALYALSQTGKTAALSDLDAIIGTGNGFYWNLGEVAGDGNQDAQLWVGSTGQYSHVWAADGSFKAARGIQTGRQTSAALPTVALVSGAGTQIDTVSDRETVTPVTFNPGAATTATCTVALSPDNVTYSTLGVETEPAGVAFDGTIHLIKVRVPAGWYIKCTVVNATLGTTTYY